VADFFATDYADEHGWLGRNDAEEFSSHEYRRWTAISERHRFVAVEKTRSEIVFHLPEAL
jgi:hypothetical protein